MGTNRTTRVSLDLADEQMETLNMVKAYMSKKMGSPVSASAAIRAAMTEYARTKRLEGGNDKAGTAVGSEADG